MESSGVYWKPLYNILEEKFEVILVNENELKKISGNMTIRTVNELPSFYWQGLKN